MEQCGTINYFLLFNFFTMKKLVFMALAVTLFFSGCVEDESINCYSGLLLHYRYELNPQNENRFGSDVDALTILAFDENGLFHEAFVVDDPAQLGENNLIHLPLPDGTWDILTWGGDMDTFEIGDMIRGPENTSRDVPLQKGVSNISNARLWISNHTEMEDGGKLVTEHLSRLYHGSLEGVKTLTGTNQIVKEEVSMMQNTNTLKVVLNGLPSSGSARADGDDPYQITVTADMTNERCRADNGICDQVRSTKHTQTRAFTNTQGQMEIDLTVMRLFTDDVSSTLTVSSPLLDEYGYENGQIVIPIVPTVLENPAYNTQTDLDRENVYEFVIDFDVDMNFTLTINRWKIIHVTPGMW